MDEKEVFLRRLSRRDKNELAKDARPVPEGCRAVPGHPADESEVDQVLKDLYLDSQISSPYIERRDLSSFMKLIDVDNETHKGIKGTCKLADENSGGPECYGDSLGVKPKVPERSRKIGLCSNNLLHVYEDEHTRYMKEYQYNTYGVIEKKQLSPIVEKKLSLNELHDMEAEKEESPSTTRKRMSGRFSKQSSKEKALESERKTSRSSPNIEKMIEELLIRHVPDENKIRALNTTEVHRKISNDESQMAGKNVFVEKEKSNSSKGFVFPFLPRFFSDKEIVKSSWSLSQIGRRTLSEGEQNDGALEIQLEGETVTYDDDVACFWEDVCFTPRTDRKRKERRMVMRRNSSPDVLLNRIKKKIYQGRNSSKDIRDSSEKKGTPKGERKEKSSSRQSTPKLSRQSSRETPTPERKRSHSRQSKRSVSNTPKSERKRNTPKLERKQDENPEKDKNDTSYAKKHLLERTASTPELFRRADRRMTQKEHYRTSSTPSLRRRMCRSSVQESSFTPNSERKGNKTKSDAQSRRLKGRHGGSVDRYDYQDIDHSSDFSLFSKKSSFSKKKQNSKEADDEVEQLNSGPVDPVYSLLKCAADLPRSGGKSPCPLHSHCSGQHGAGGGYARYPSGGDSSGNTSKTSSPSSSASHSPKTRRKKLNARMKSFSLDTPEPPKQLLGIDETTKKKSSSFTNTCFGGAFFVGKESPDEKMSFSASALRKKFALGRASSLETDDKKHTSYTPSPKESPKSQRKDRPILYVALYNFKAKEKDDMDLRAGWRVTVTDSSKKDWWKGKSHGKSGYFPATYVIPISYDQRVFQVLQALNLSDGTYAIKFHKDQIVLQVGDEIDGMIMIRAANNRQAMCPFLYLQEL